MTVRQLPVIHARDHIHGGADPIGVGQFEIKLFPDQAMATLAELDLPVEAGTNLFVFALPKDLDGSSLRRAEGFLTTAGSGPTTVQVRNRTKGETLLSTPVTIDAGEFSSATAAAQAVPIVTDPVTGLGECAWGNLIAVDVTAAGAGAWGLGVILEFTR